MEIRKHVTYANVISTLAAFGVLAGGGAYAATRITAKDIGRNAVTSRAVKNKSLRAADVRPDTLTGAQIREDSLDLRAHGAVLGDEGPNLACDPGPTFTPCGDVKIVLQRRSRVLAMASAGLIADGAPTSLSCQIRFDAADDPAGVNYGEAVSDNSDALAPDGFSTNRVSDPLDAGAHTATLMCREAIGSARVTNQEINAIAVPVD